MSRHVGLKPPDKKWKLLELALNDLRKAERSKKYEVDMGQWHVPNSVCKVCLAGAVMAFSLDANQSEEVDPGDFDDGWDEALSELDSMRCGHFWGVGQMLYDRLSQVYGDADRPGYGNDRLKWFRTMRKCVRILKEANV